MAKFEKADEYRSLVDWTDFKDNNRQYRAGDVYQGDMTVTRLKELLADDNKGRTDKLVGAPIIEAVVAE